MDSYLFRLLVLMTIINTTLYPYTIKHKIEKIDANTEDIKVTLDLKPNEILYKDSFYPTVNDNAIKLSQVTSDKAPSTFFDESYNANKEGYKNSITFSFQAKKEPTADGANAIVHSHFSINNIKQPQEYVIKLNFSPSLSQTEQSEHNTQDSAQESDSYGTSTNKTAHSSFFGALVQKLINYIGSTIVKYWKDALYSMFVSTGSGVIRFIVSFVLGILLSFTPCIYPMIPITVGILQANQSKSGLRNFLLAAAYTLGISLTFAFLGLLAALGGSVFGELQGSPWVIIPLVIFLGYLGLAMFGFYEMYIPKFLRPKATQVKGGSILSALIFGLISGTVASPCMSPGLALILDWVTNLSKNSSIAAYTEGFALLFIFGIGSSLPLLIIGTFSSTIDLLPRAGQWMVEVKKILGMMLIGMCFYHLSHLENIIPWYILVWAIVICLIIFGIYYFMSINKYNSTAIKRFKNFMGALLIVSACIMAVQGYKAYYEHINQKDIWLHDYNQAVQNAKKENKRLFIDIGSTTCSACKVLDHKLFKNKSVLEALDNYVLVKIESNVHETAYEEVKNKFGSYIQKTGFPTLLIIDQNSEQVIKHWGIDINDSTIEQVIQEFNNYSH